MIKTEEFLVNMGPQHPSTHGVLKLVLALDGEVIVECTPHMGFLHRSMEKLAESKSYTQFIPYCDRLDYLAGMSNEICYVQAVEKLSGISVPERAEYIRVIMAELNRIASHLVWLGALAGDLGALTPIFYTFRERERIITCFEKLSGQRLTYNYIRFGGVVRDLYDGFKEEVNNFLDEFLPLIDEYEKLLTGNRIFLERTKNIGIINKIDAINYGLTGPNLRASGVKWDLRHELPYGIYDRFKDDFEIPTGNIGDCFDRYKVRIEEMRQSSFIVQKALKDIPDGETKIKTPRVIKPPKGEIYHRFENPRGELAYYIVSDGTERPYRLKIRGPSFINIQILSKILCRVKIADVVIILGSLDFVLGEIDK